MDNSSSKDSFPLSRNGHYATARDLQREGLVAQWLGDERASQVIGEMRGPGKSIQELVDDSLRKMKLGDTATFNSVRENWSKIVGASVAKMIRPLRLRSGKLVIEAASPSFLMVYRQPQLQQRLLAELRRVSKGEITQVSFVAQGQYGGKEAYEQRKNDGR